MLNTHTEGFETCVSIDHQYASSLWSWSRGFLLPHTLSFDALSLQLNSPVVLAGLLRQQILRMGN